ncbi:MAG: AAA family ATPase [Burkholderiaceae bacterium]|nr:AAA family ATPase [Burkholderiaceae bacterium]
MSTELRTLILRLDAETRAAMERAAELCAQQTHFSVDPEHLLAELLRSDDSSLAALLAHFRLSLPRTREQLQQALERLKRGNGRTPVLSEHLPPLLEQAWVIASMQLGESQIDAGCVLLAALESSAMRGLLLESAPNLLQLPREALRTELRGRAGAPAAASLTLAARTKTPALDQYTNDLTAQAATGALDPVVGRDDEIRQLIEVLMRRRQNNPILTGEAGVGKTAVVEGFAQRVVAGTVPPALQGVSVRALDLGLLQAGAGMRGEFERRLKEVIVEVKAAVPPVVLFIDEAHQLIGAGGSEGAGDAANLLKPALARGELRTIAATTWSEYKQFIERDPALTRRFQVVKIDEPHEDVAVEMLRGVLPRLEQHHRLRIDEGALRDAVQLSHRYLRARQLPDKAIGVLDTACARVAHAGGSTVDREAVADVLSSWTGIPLGRMLADEQQTVLQLHDRLKERIIGQDDALDAIARRIRSHRAGLDDPAKPVGVFLLAGPSGVGKTETACQLAELLYGGTQHMITVNLSEFQEAHSVAGLKGAPPGYVGYGRGGVLTEAVRRQPYSLILLDEMEKAHPDVLELFYQVFDKGTMDDAEGTTIDFRNTLILLTSNAGQDVVAGVCARNPDAGAAEINEALRPALLRQFPSAFLGRVVLVPYRPIPDAQLRRIVGLKLAQLADRLRRHHGADFTWDDYAAEAIAARCHEVESGARNIDHIITQSLLPELASQVLERLAAHTKFSRVRLTVDVRSGFRFELSDGEVS